MKRRLMTVLAIVGLLAVAALGIAAVASAQEWPTVKPIMTVTCDGTTDTFVILIQNNSPDRLLSMDIRAALHGNKLLTSWAGGNPYLHRAKNYGDSIGWVNQSNIAPGRAQGPFVFTMDHSGEAGISHTWLRFKTDKVSADVTGDLVVAH